MATISVKPIDGSGRYRWKVMSGRIQVSKHEKKNRAKERAKQEARNGDRVVILKQSGATQKSYVKGDKPETGRGHYTVDNML